jgi:hypothetical protein
VQRKELALFLRPLALPLLDHLRHAPVQVATALERQALVGGVPDQGVPEAEGARSVRVALDELPEPLPGVRRRSDVLVSLEDVVDQRAREGDTEHRGPSQQRAVARVEPVDPCGD